MDFLEGFERDPDKAPNPFFLFLEGPLAPDQTLVASHPGLKSLELEVESPGAFVDGGLSALKPLPIT